MNPQTISRAFSLVLVFVLVAAFLPGAVAAAENNERTISTSGSAEAMVTPDRAHIIVAVVTENANVQAAQSENARIMDSVSKSIENLGIEKKDLKTTGYSIYPVYEDSKVPFGQKVKYYRVANRLEITIRDVSRTGEVIDTAVKSGANQVDSIEFQVSDELEQSLRDELLAKAVKKAYSDASIVAGAAGVTITGVKQITVASSYPPRLYKSLATYASGDNVYEQAPTPIEAGEVKVTAEVSAVYLIG
ncbi:MAG: SIMPL domain-containing protein [Methanolinea sp.]|nr:SIMPL domain-containing protein [Methanolinea sp.]